MRDTPKAEYLSPDYIRFGKNERSIHEILDRTQKNKNSAKPEKKNQSSEENFYGMPEFSDRSSLLSGSLSSLALVNMIKLKKLKSKIDTLDMFIDRKMEEYSGVFNPFASFHKEIE